MEMAAKMTAAQEYYVFVPLRGFSRCGLVVIAPASQAGGLRFESGQWQECR